MTCATAGPLRWTILDSLELTSVADAVLESWRAADKSGAPQYCHFGCNLKIAPTNRSVGSRVGSRRFHNPKIVNDQIMDT